MDLNLRVADMVSSMNYEEPWNGYTYYYVGWTADVSAPKLKPVFPPPVPPLTLGMPLIICGI